VTAFIRVVIRFSTTPRPLGPLAMARGTRSLYA
jgi:hypothetical protein